MIKMISCFTNVAHFSVSIFSLLSRGNITIHIEYGNRTKIDIISIFGSNGRRRINCMKDGKLFYFC